MPRCPGQDQRYWTPEDIFDVKCSSCGNEIEFWKDEPMRICPSCQKEVRNPRIDLGCAKWCKHAEECLGKMPGALPAIPLIENLKARLEELPGITAEILQKADIASCEAEKEDLEGNEEIVVTKATALISSVIKDLNIEFPADFFTKVEIEDELAAKIRDSVADTLK